MRCFTSRHSKLRQTLPQGSPSNRVMLLMARARLLRTLTSRRPSYAGIIYQKQQMYSVPPKKPVLKQYITRHTAQECSQKRKLYSSGLATPEKRPTPEKAEMPKKQRYPLSPMKSPPGAPSLDDITKFNEVLSRGEKKLATHSSTRPSVSSFNFETVPHQAQSRPSVKSVPSVLESTKNTLTPASMKVAIKRLINKYKPLYLRSEPQVDAVFRSAMRKGYLAAARILNSPKKENRKICAIGRNICRTSCLQMRAASTSAELGKYNKSLWESMQKFIVDLPIEKRQDFQKIINVGLLVASQMISAAADSFDLSAYQYCQGISMQRFAQRRFKYLMPRVQQKPINRTFSGSTVFGSKLDYEIHRKKAASDSKSVDVQKKRVHHDSL